MASKTFINLDEKKEWVAFVWERLTAHRKDEYPVRDKDPAQAAPEEWNNFSENFFNGDAFKGLLARLVKDRYLTPESQTALMGLFKEERTRLPSAYRRLAPDHSSYLAAAASPWIFVGAKTIAPTVTETISANASRYTLGQIIKATEIARTYGLGSWGAEVAGATGVAEVAIAPEVALGVEGSTFGASLGAGLLIGGSYGPTKTFGLYTVYTVITPLRQIIRPIGQTTLF